MDAEKRKESLREAGTRAWRTTVLVGATIIILGIYTGLAFLVYRDRIADGPFLLFTGVIVGYVMRSLQNYLRT
jgi:Ca2+/Na+ antiporter